MDPLSTSPLFTDFLDQLHLLAEDLIASHKRLSILNRLGCRGGAERSLDTPTVVRSSCSP